MNKDTEVSGDAVAEYQVFEKPIQKDDAEEPFPGRYIKECKFRHKSDEQHAHGYDKNDHAPYDLVFVLFHFIFPL